MTKSNQTEIDFVKSRMPYIEAFMEGKEVQYFDSAKRWEKVALAKTLLLDTFHSEPLQLRIAPEPVRVLFGPTDVHGKRFQLIDGGDWHPCGGIKPNGVYIAASFYTWEELAEEFNQSPDGGLTWKPCWKEEER